VETPKRGGLSGQRSRFKASKGVDGYESGCGAQGPRLMEDGDDDGVNGGTSHWGENGFIPVEPADVPQLVQI